MVPRLALSVLAALDWLLAAVRGREWGRDYRALACLEHQSALARVGRSVVDLDGDDIGAGLQEDLVLHRPYAVAPGHHVPQGVARAVGH